MSSLSWWEIRFIMWWCFISYLLRLTLAHIIWTECAFIFFHSWFPALCRFASDFFFKNFNFQFRFKVHPEWYHDSCIVDHLMCLMHALHSHFHLWYNFPSDFNCTVNWLYAVCHRKYLHILMAWQIFLLNLFYLCIQ